MPEFDPFAALMQEQADQRFRAVCVATLFAGLTGIGLGVALCAWIW